MQDVAVFLLLQILHSTENNTPKLGISTSNKNILKITIQKLTKRLLWNQGNELSTHHIMKVIFIWGWHSHKMLWVSLKISL